MEVAVKELFKIDKKLPIPLYYQLKAQLLQAFDAGVFVAGDKLPTEVELCEMLEISRPTVRQAYNELISEGYIMRLKAKGTFVSQQKVEGYFFQKLGSFDEEMKSLGLAPSTRVLLAEIIPASMEYKERFSCETLFHLKRLRFADNKEMVYVDTYLPYVKFAGIEKNDFVKRSLYHVLEDEYDCVVSYVDRVVEAKRPDADTKKQLKMEDDAIILQVVTTAYTKEDVPIEFSIARYHGDRNKFKMRLIR